MSTGDGDAYVETKRGVTTIYNGLFPVGRVKRNGKLEFNVRGPQPRWSRVKVVQYIEGQTLSRVVVVDAGLNTFFGVFRTVSDRVRESQCDDCINRHQPSNTNCSATLKLKSFASSQGTLYEWGTKRPAGKWRKQDVYVRPRVCTGTATYSKT